MAKQLTLIIFITLLFSTVALADDWAVPKSWSVQTQQISFDSEDYQLSGTLYWPDNRKKIAAVVIPQQAGGDGLRDNLLYQQKVRLFNSLGYAVFVYDRRGVGDSEGPEKRLSYDSLAIDAVAAKRAISQHDAINQEQIGFWGLSQSGWITMMAANKSEAAFAIVVSSPLTTPEEQMDVLTYNYVRFTHGKEAAEQALSVRLLVMTDYFEGRAEYAEIQRAIRSIQDKPWFGFLNIPRTSDFPEDISDTTWPQERIFNPMEIAEGLSVPTLFILGGRDIDIPVKRTLELIETSDLKETLDVIVIPDADHVMRPFKEPDQRSGKEFKGAEVPEYFANIGAWLAQTLRARATA